MLKITTKTNDKNRNNQVLLANIENISNLGCLAVLTTPNRATQLGQSVTGE